MYISATESTGLQRCAMCVVVKGSPSKYRTSRCLCTDGMITTKLAKNKHVSLFVAEEILYSITAVSNQGS